MFHTGVAFSLGSVLQEERACKQVGMCVRACAVPGEIIPVPPFEGSVLWSCFHTAPAAGFLPRLTPRLLVDTSDKLPGANTFLPLTTEASGGAPRRRGGSNSECHPTQEQKSRALKNKHDNRISPPVVSTDQLMPLTVSAVFSPLG